MNLARALAVMLFVARLPGQTADFMALARHATELQQSGDYAGAADAYRQLAALHPDDVVAHVNRGVCLVRLGRFDEAITEYQAADKLLPNDPRIALNLALAYQKGGRLREATERFESLHAAHPDDPKVTMLLADCHLQSGGDQRVIELLRPVAQSSDDLGIAYMLGMALLHTGKLDEAQVFLDRILRKGDSVEARFLLGLRMFESGDYPAAVKQLAAAAQLNPRLPQLQSLYGQALLHTGDPDAAADAFRKELAINPNDYAANLGLAQILTARKQLEEAKPFAEAALRLNPRAAIESARASDAGPKVNDAPPDFELPNPATGEKVRLSAFRGKSPVVLIFGSYSCPNFRSSAEALKKLQKDYGAKVPFLLVYIREAHAGDNWQSTRNIRDGIKIAPAASLQEKESHAMMCSRQLHLPFPAVVDGMDGAVETAYHAWPSRAFVIGADGRVRYSTRLTELDFDPAEMESALRKLAIP